MNDDKIQLDINWDRVLNDKGDKITTTGRFTETGRIERGNLFQDGIMAKSYVDTSPVNFGRTEIAFQGNGQEHRDWGKNAEGVVLPAPSNKIYCI